jgi:cell division protein FtsB
MINLHPASALSELSGNKNRVSRRKLKRTLIVLACIVGVIILTGGIGYLVYQKDARALMAKALSGKDNFYTHNIEAVVS